MRLGPNRFQPRVDGEQKGNDAECQAYFGTVASNKAKLLCENDRRGRKKLIVQERHIAKDNDSREPSERELNWHRWCLGCDPVDDRWRKGEEQKDERER